MVEHSDEVLRFTRHLLEQEDSRLPEFMRHTRDEIGDELGVIALGLYDGGDPKLLNSYLDHYKKRLSGDLFSVNEAREKISAVGMIPSPQAADFLLELLESAPPTVS